MGPFRIRATLATAGAMLALFPGMPQSQEADGGLVTRFDITQSLRSHSNLRLEEAPAGSTYRADTAFGFGLSSETRRDRLSFDLGFVLRAEDDPSFDSVSGLVDPSLRLEYAREVGRSRLSFDLTAAESELDGTNLIFDPDLGGFSLIVDTGTRLTYGFGALLELGTEGPFGLDIDLRTRGNNFSGTSNPNLFDRRTDSAELRSRFEFSPVLTGTASIFYSHFSSEDVVPDDRETTALTFGLTYQLDPVTEVTATLGGRRIEEVGEETEESAEGSLRWEREISRGTFSAEVSRELTAGGRLTRAGIARAFAFQTGTLELGLGTVNVEDDGRYPALSLAYRRDWPRGTFGLSLSGDVNVTADGDAQQVIRAAANYTHALTSLSELSIGIDFVDVDDVADAGLAARQTGGINATYSRTVARDWQFSVGAAHRFIEEEGIERRDNSVFVSLNRTLTFRR